MTDIAALSALTDRELDVRLASALGMETFMNGPSEALCRKGADWYKVPAFTSDSSPRSLLAGVLAELASRGRIKRFRHTVEELSMENFLFASARQITIAAIVALEGNS